MIQPLSFPRRFRSLRRFLAPLRAVGHWQSDREFRNWTKRNRGKTYAEFYAADIEDKIRQGRHHFTLGTRGWGPGHVAVEWDRETFARQGLALWQQMLAFGLRDDMRCVDYGCGSLRIGQHAMRFLARGNYFGIDVVDAFIAEGLKLIDPQLLEDKHPNLGIINEETLLRVREWKPDFIFSNAVLQHVPPDELGLYFQRLETMIGPGTQAFILFIAAHRLRRVRKMSWVYPADHLRSVIAASAPSLEVAVDDIDPAVARAGGHLRRVLKIGLSAQSKDAGVGMADRSRLQSVGGDAERPLR